MSLFTLSASAQAAGCTGTANKGEMEHAYVSARDAHKVNVALVEELVIRSLGAHTQV